MDIQSNGTAAGTILYHYTPNAGAALFAVAGFGVGTIIHVVAMCFFRTWFFIPLILGSIREWPAFVCDSAS